MNNPPKVGLGTILGFLSATMFPFGIFQLVIMPSNVFPFDFLSKGVYAFFVKFSLFKILESLNNLSYKARFENAKIKESDFSNSKFHRSLLKKCKPINAKI